MRLNYLFATVFLSATVLFTSCIKDEALNTEADIESASIKNGSVILQMSPIIGDNTITFRLKNFAESFEFAPEFTLTPGATIEPKSGTKLDFTTSKKYTVTSEDGVWKKTYTVSFIVDDNADFNFSFENVEIINTESPEGHYHEFFDYLETRQIKKDWSSGNGGFNIMAATLVLDGEQLTPEFYPTAQTTDGFIGKGAKLQTKSTGQLGAMFGSPLAAGNLYIGTFKLTFPAIKSTLFGLPYLADKAPIALKGYFKYQAGSDFKVNNKPSELTKDSWDAYAILFEKREKDNFLSGDHGFNDARIVSIARIRSQDRIETNEWTQFNIPFEFINGKKFDPKKEYMYTIVFSSSLEGDRYNGAVGSTLWIDEVELVTEE